jgi:TRAP-type C4-dicarboxylate transport system substrate-binding protein
MQKLVDLSRQDNAESIELMKKNGIKVVEIPEQNLSEFVNAGVNAQQKMVGKLYSQELLDKVKTALTEFRKNSNSPE